jgi:hypothetical protein
VTSYVRAKLDPEYETTESTWIFTEAVMTRAVATFVGAYLVDNGFLSMRVVCLVGSFIGT